MTVIVALALGCTNNGPIAPSPGDPVAKFVHSAATGYFTDKPVDFDATLSADPLFPIDSYLWDFGDGTAPITSAAPKISHAFDRAGVHTVKLTIGDVAGRVSSASSACTIAMTTGLIATVDFPYTVSNVEISGDYAYLLESQTKLHVIDMHNPHSPQKVASMTFPDLIFDIKIRDQYAFIPDENQKIHVIDIANPLNPHEVSAIDMPGYVNSVDFFGDYLLVGDWNAGTVNVVDVSVLSAPEIIGTVEIPGDFGSPGREVVAYGNYVYLASFWSQQVGYFQWATKEQITIIDLTDPSNPLIAGSVGMRDVTFGHFSIVNLVLAGSYLYSTDQTGKMDIYDLADPVHPELVETRQMDLDYGEMESAPGRLYAAGLGRIVAYDISNPVDPVEIGSASSSAYEIAVSEPYVLAVNGMWRQLFVYEFDR